MSEGEKGYTPGPLHIFKMLHPKFPRHWLVLTDACDEDGAHIVVGETWKEENAKLMAAAPDLLEVLKAFHGNPAVRAALAPPDSLGSLLAAADRAINKALGKE